MDNNWKLSDMHRKIEAARNDDMSAFSSPEEYAEYKQQSELLDPSNFMGMGSTRAVRELGPTVGKIVNKMASETKSLNQTLSKPVEDLLDYARSYKKRNDIEDIILILLGLETLS